MPRGVATLDCEYHSQAGWTIRGPPKMTLMAKSRSCGYNMVKQYGIRVMEQARAQPGWCFATVLWVRGGHPGASKCTQRVQ